MGRVYKNNTGGIILTIPENRQEWDDYWNGTLQKEQRRQIVLKENQRSRIWFVSFLILIISATSLYISLKEPNYVQTNYYIDCVVRDANRANYSTF